MSISKKDFDRATHTFITSVLGGLVVAYFLGEASIVYIVGGILLVAIISSVVNLGFKKLFF